MSQLLRWSSISNFSSRKEALENQFKLSGQWLKKHGIGKDWLQKPCHFKDELSLPIEVMNKGMISPIYSGPQALILQETSEFLAVHKPCQVHSHPLSYSDEINVLSFLRQENKFSFLDVNSNNYDRGLLYRLDYETSGLLILTNQEAIYQEARAHFSTRVKEKKYLAIVQGKTPKELSVTSYLTPSSFKGEKMKVSERSLGSDSFEARLSIKTLDYNEKEDLSFILVNLETGIRHQIRAQMSFLGHAILGDVLYEGRKSDRLYLHCYFYKFHLNEKDYEFKDESLGSFSRLFNLNSCL